MPVHSTSDTPKILHVVLSMAVGGAEKLVYDMVRHPAFETLKPIICCLDALGELGDRLREDGYAVYLKHRKSGIDLSVIPWLRKIIKRELVDVVHAHQYTPLFYAAPAALLAGSVKVVYTEHGRFYPDRKNWKRTLFNPMLALGVDHLVSISRATAQAMAEFDNLPMRRIQVIHNGVDLSRMNPTIDTTAKRRELGLEDGCRIVGTAARLDEVKNLPMMLRSFKLVLKSVPQAMLVIAGEGPLGESLIGLAGELGVADRVKFIGLRFDMPEIYQLFEVFLLTSFSEGISVTLLEAMASGVPAVVTAVGGNGEVVQDGVSGYLVPVDADEEFAGHIISLLGDPSLMQQFAHFGEELANSQFSFQKMISAYAAKYAA